MPNVKRVPGAAKKPAAGRKAKAVDKSAAPRKPRARRVLKPGPAEPVSPPAEDRPEVSMGEAQAQVVASKFTGGEGPSHEAARPASRPTPTLPITYGESHLLLLVRDPQTLFAAWDMSPSTTAGLKARMGGRAFAVSTLTLRLIAAGSEVTVFHLGKKARSRYLKIDGAPSFIAEIGFTSPAGRFELIARSAPCFVPLGATVRPEPGQIGGRAMLGYRAARALARRGLSASAPGGKGRTRLTESRDGASTSSSPGSAKPRVLGGASDLYRR